MIGWLSKALVASWFRSIPNIHAGHDGEVQTSRHSGARSGLGTINHTLLTLAALHAAELPCSWSGSDRRPEPRKTAKPLKSSATSA